MPAERVNHFVEPLTGHASDDSELLAHDGTGWTYSAAAFVPGGTPIVRLSTLCAPEDNVAVNDYFGLQRFGLAYDLDGSAGEGFVIRVTTGQPNTVQAATFRVGIQFRTG